jgi:hypothetical protein
MCMHFFNIVECCNRGLFLHIVFKDTLLVMVTRKRTADKIGDLMMGAWFISNFIRLSWYSKPQGFENMNTIPDMYRVSDQYGCLCET